MATLDRLPDPNPDSGTTAGTRELTGSGTALVNVNVGTTDNPIWVWNQEIVTIGRDELSFLSDMDGNITADLTPGRVLTLTAENQLTTSLQGSLSRAGVIFSELVPGAGIAEPQPGFEYFVYDVSLLLGQPSGDTFVTRGIGSDEMGNIEAFFMGTTVGGNDDEGNAIEPYYIYRF